MQINFIPYLLHYLDEYFLLSQCHANISVMICMFIDLILQ